MLAEELEKETRKWMVKARKKVKTIRPLKREDLYKNALAYIEDSEHFLKKGDLIRSFEAVVWAWAWLEILTELECVECL
jgi:hypothetical protein